MASIQSLGIASGLLTSELVEDIVASERGATDLRIDAQRTVLEAKVSAYGTIRSTMDGLRSATAALSSSATLLTMSAGSSDDTIVTASATTSAAPGKHSVEVFALATPHTLMSIRFDDITDVIGEGTLDFRFGTTTFDTGVYDSFTENTEVASQSVTIDASSSSVTGIRDAINEANIGVSASIVNDGTGYLLVLKSDATGEDNGMEITVTEGAVAGLSALSFNAGQAVPGVNMTQSVDAEDASVTIDGVPVTRESNTVREVIEGVTFNLNSLTTGTPVTVSIEQDTQAVEDKLQAFVDAFNEVKTLTDQLSEFDKEDEIGALLIGDSLLRNVRVQMRRLMSTSIGGLEDSGIRSLLDLGISTDQSNGYQLRFDSADFVSAIQSSPDSVQGLLASLGSASDPLVRFVSHQSSSRAGTYDVEISQVATRGQQLGATVPGLGGAITIDADNDDLVVVVDGVTSGAITLTQAVYADADALAQQIETQINVDSTLKGAQRSVDVSYEATNQRFVISSTRYGSGSQVGIDAVDTDTLAVLGFGVDTGETAKGVDVAGTINGVDANGAGQFLVVPKGPQPATSGTYRGTSITGFDTPPLTIDGTNNTFSISVDGTTSNTVSLSQTGYSTGADLATEIQTQINADANLVAADVAVSVTYDTVGKLFQIVSTSTGVASTVVFTDVPAPTEAALGFSIGAGNAGKNASTKASVAAGIQVHVIGGAVGQRGSVTLIRGVMDQLDTFLDDTLGFGGSLDTKVNSLDAQLEGLDEQKADFDKRMESLEARLRTQFAATDALIAELNTTSQFLDRQLSILPIFNQDND